MIVLTEEKKMKHLKIKLQGQGYVRDPFLITDFIDFYRTQVSPGSDLWAQLSETN